MKTQSSASLSSLANLPYRVTIFGAESTGKTTLSRQLAKATDATWLYEFARPYLEQTKAPINKQSMTTIWHGQAVLQSMAQGGLIVQDTDLFSTVGYWQFPHWRDTLGVCPNALITQAKQWQSDLYVITPSNIPFETDPLRFGGDKREGSDAYWIRVCQQYDLPYVVLKGQGKKERLAETIAHIKERSVLCVA